MYDLSSVLFFSLSSLDPSLWEKTVELSLCKQKSLEKEAMTFVLRCLRIPCREVRMRKIQHYFVRYMI